MQKTTGYLLIAFAIALYLLSAASFIDYLYSLTIRDTVTAVENAFGKLVIVIFMLVLAKFSMSAGREKLNANADSEEVQKDGENADNNEG